MLVDDGSGPLECLDKCNDIGWWCGDVLQDVFSIGQQHNHAFFFRALFERENLVDGLFVGGIATEPPYGVGRVEDGAAIAERIYTVLYVVFEVHHSSWLLVMVSAHLKCPSGHCLWPCKPQGRQASVSVVSTTCACGRTGPNPNCGMVEQNRAVSGAFMAEAKCSGAESFV